LTPAGYVLLTRSRQIDSALFMELVAEAREAEPARALEKLEEGLALWRGHPMGDLGYEQWAAPTAAKLVETHASALELRLDALSALGREAEVAAETEQLVVDHPTREGMWERRARALYRVGDQATALRALHQARSFLGEELGLEPGPALSAIEQQILKHDPALHGRVVAMPASGRRRNKQPPTIDLDKQRRAPLGNLASHDRYVAYKESDGTIVLVPAAKRARRAANDSR
jgi:DNA-binding SARP family transcriptional activator